MSWRTLVLFYCVDDATNMCINLLDWEMLQLEYATPNVIESFIQFIQKEINFPHVVEGHKPAKC